MPTVVNKVVLLSKTKSMVKTENCSNSVNLEDTLICISNKDTHLILPNLEFLVLLVPEFRMTKNS